MRVLVLGQGVAALGVLWALRKYVSQNKNYEVTWVAPSGDRDFNCSLHSTALVARQGIKKGLSPLGDLLSDSFDKTKSFFEDFNPQGVSDVIRIHHFPSAEAKKKARDRFGVFSHGDHHEEQAFIIHPKTYLSWWCSLIEEQLKIKRVDDWVSEVQAQKALGFRGVYAFDLCIDCRGSSLKDFENLEGNFKKVPGHYCHWYHPEISAELKTSSWVQTLEGHNLIYHHERDKLILGGTNQKDSLLGPEFLDLQKQLDFFKQNLLGLSKLSLNDAQILTGIRTKASKRLPYFKQLKAGHWALGGYYKNGYTLSFGFSMRALEGIL